MSATAFDPATDPAYDPNWGEPMPRLSVIAEVDPDDPSCVLWTVHDHEAGHALSWHETKAEADRALARVEARERAMETRRVFA